MTAPAVASSVNLRVLLEEMIERDASDLHITAGEKPKMRIDGEIQSSRLEFVMSPSTRSFGRSPAVMCRSEASRSIISSRSERRLRLDGG